MSEAMRLNISMNKTIYIALLNEGVSVSRPTQAVELKPGMFKVLETDDYDPELEDWEFKPGSVVECESSNQGGVEVLTATRKIDYRECWD